MPRCCQFVLLGLLAACASGLLAQEQLGKIIGQIRVDRSDFPAHPILVELQLRFSTINSVYADSQGRFGFYNLEANAYHVLIKDDAFLPIDQLAAIDPLISPTAMLQITLRLRPDANARPLENRMGGSNPYIVGLDEYRKHFPKSVLKEFDKGLHADQDGKRDEAMAHYERALKAAPGFYPAHNNLGSDYLNKADLDGARREFEEVIRLNQGDAAAYFNLSNVSILTGKLADAQQFLEEGLRREPDSALGQFLLGSLDMRTGKYQQAEGALRRAVQVSPVMTQARLQLVNLLLKLGRNPEAIAELHAFIDAFPGNGFTPQAKQLLQRLDGPASSENHNRN
jgi:tetratricopeptide (TPR) repeat protein